ncbi:hypothetical protein LOZ33_003898, partial [Ophidiomyces ophidiicola]
MLVRKYHPPPLRPFNQFNSKLDDGAWRAWFFGALDQLLDLRDVGDESKSAWP